MSITVNVQDAKTRLSELLKRVEAGERVTIARSGKPIAEIHAVTPRKPRFGGVIPGLTVPPEFFDDLSEQEMALWEGGDE